MMCNLSRVHVNFPIYSVNPRGDINKEGLLLEMNLVSPANWLALKGSGVNAKGLTLSLGVNKDRLVSWLMLPATQTDNASQFCLSILKIG